MAERLSGLMLLGLVLWTVIGVIGLLLARSRGESSRFLRGARTLSAIWIGYWVVLVGVSLRARPRLFRSGEDRCFRSMCFAVIGAEEPTGFRVRGQEPERLLRVLVRVRNRDRKETRSETGLGAYLIDGKGRRWEPVPGLGGVRLTTAVAAGGETVSEPVFRLPKDVTELRLVLRHTRWTTARLRVGDAESYFHPPAEMAVPAAEK
jgi:hypothetical protein